MSLCEEVGDPVHLFSGISRKSSFLALPQFFNFRFSNVLPSLICTLCVVTSNTVFPLCGSSFRWTYRRNAIPTGDMQCERFSLNVSDIRNFASERSQRRFRLLQTVQDVEETASLLLNYLAIFPPTQLVVSLSRHRSSPLVA